MLDVPSYMELSEQPGSNVLLVVFLGYRALFMHRSIYDSFLVT